MLATILAAFLAAAPQGGTVYTADGGRLRGTILDAGASGVTVQLADGSTRKLEAAQVSRVDFADGTSWKPTPAGQAAPAKPAPMAIPLDKLDTVYLARGGRARCLVTEEGPEGVVVRLVDGSERRFAPGQVARIDWADGTRSELAPQAPAAPAAQAPAAAAPAPAPAAPMSAAPAAPPAK